VIPLGSETNANVTICAELRALQNNNATSTSPNPRIFVSIPAFTCATARYLARFSSP
jgi:hypothetical protein